MLFEDWDDEKWKVLVKKGFKGNKSYHLKGPSTTFVFNEHDFLQLHRNISSIAENIHEKEPYFIHDGTIINREIGTQLLSVVDDCEELNRLYKENKALKEELLYYSKKYEIQEHGAENEKSETIKELVEMDKETAIEVEHINNIYNKIGFNGIIEYAKEKLACYGAVREVDKGLWLMATGGWSDNEFWLDCLNQWNCIFSSKHLRATTPGGGFYYSETPYADITIRLEKGKVLE